MPLRAGNSPAIKSQNIREFHTGKTYAHTKAKFGKKRADAQAIAVAMSTARKYGKKAAGGGVQDQDDPQAPGLNVPEPSPSIAPSLRERAIGVATDWLSKYGHLAGFGSEGTGVEANPFGMPPGANYSETNPEKVVKGLITGPYRGIQGLIDQNKEAVEARRRAETMPGSEEEIYLANLEAQNKERALAGQALATGIGLTGARGITPGEAGTLGALGSKPPPAGKFFHPYDLDPAELKGAKQITPQKGSNPGGTYELPSGEPVYIKTPPTPDHAYNEKLAAELYKLAGVPVADVKMTKFNGKPSIVSPIIPGKTLNQVGDYGLTQDLGHHQPADLWLGNYDWVGTGKDNVIVDPTNRAWRIDTGGALRYRAQGALKGPDMWGPEVKPFDLSKSPDMADVMDYTPKKWEQPTAQRVANISDDQIKGLVDKYGPLAKGEKEKLTDTLIARRDGVAKMYGVGNEPQAPPAPPNIQQHVDTITNAFQKDPAKVANFIWEHANKNGAASADAIVKQLPHELWPEIDAHLDEISTEKGYDPWKGSARPAPDDWMEAKWGDDPDHPATEPPMGPEGWGGDKNYTNPDFKFTSEPHWWDDLGKYGTIHTPEKPPGGWTEGALSNAFKDRRFARALTPQEWQNWKPPTVGGKPFLDPKVLPEDYLQKARAIGANTNFMIAKGYNPHFLNEKVGVEKSVTGHEYPKEIENPKSKSHGYAEEHANYFADAHEIADAYGTKISSPYFVIARNPLEVYYPAFKRATPAKTGEHIIGEGAEYSSNMFTQMIHAAHKNGHDWLILHGVNDSGGSNHTQYLMLNHKGTVRGIGADLDPNKKWSPRPLDALVAAPVGWGAYKALSSKDDNQ